MDKDFKDAVGKYTQVNLPSNLREYRGQMEQLTEELSGLLGNIRIRFFYERFPSLEFFWKTDYDPDLINTGLNTFVEKYPTVQIMSDVNPESAC